jgi:DNA-binding CsgD family transcriptional regulator
MTKPLPVTDRQREVALLVTAGLSDRQTLGGQPGRE